MTADFQSESRTSAGGSIATPLSSSVEMLKIVLLCIVSAIAYGIVHDQFTRASTSSISPSDIRRCSIPNRRRCWRLVGA